jgi:hypothetical protein
VSAAAESDVPAWLALRRAQRGTVTKVDGDYLDHGRPMPDYLTDALDNLTRTGFMILADPDPGGVRRASITQAGLDRLAALTDRLNDAPVRTVQHPAHRRTVSPADFHHHAIHAILEDGVVITRCGQHLSGSAPARATHDEPECPRCRAVVVSELVPPPKFGPDVPD